MSSTLEDLFATDQTAEENGVWIDLGDMKFLIRSYSCKAAVDLREKLQKSWQPILRTPNGKIPDDEAEKINLKVLAGAIIADWKIPSGTPAEGEQQQYEKFTADAAYEKMKAMPRFASWVAQQAIDAQNYKNSAAEDALGN